MKSAWPADINTSAKLNEMIATLCGTTAHAINTPDIKKVFYIVSLIASTSLMFAQTSGPKQKPVPQQDTFDWTDTTYVLVDLSPKVQDQKIVVIDIGKKAGIYIGEKTFRQQVVKSTNSYQKASIAKLIHFLDSASAKSDTVFINQYLPYLDYMVSALLKKGDASVFYKKQKAFVPAISHRLERYGKYAYRFFYLPDKRPFFSTMEVSGILDDKGPFAFSNPEELEKLAEKLASLDQE